MRDKIFKTSVWLRHSKHNRPYTAANERHHDRNSAQDWERIGDKLPPRQSTLLQFNQLFLWKRISGTPQFWVQPLEPSSGLLLSGPGPPDWSRPSSWLLANKGLVSMPGCEMFVPRERSGKGLHGRWIEGNKHEFRNLCWGLKPGNSFLHEGSAWKCTFRITCRNMQSFIFAALRSAQSQKLQMPKKQSCRKATPSEWVSSGWLLNHMWRRLKVVQSHMCLIWTSFLPIGLHALQRDDRTIVLGAWQYDLHVWYSITSKEHK